LRSDIKHLREITQLREEFNRLLSAERDRRYAEVNIEREKALKIKEEADKTALGLAREIQVYKDEKANELRSQIERERGSYATKEDLAASAAKLEAVIKPITDYMLGQQGRSTGISTTTAAIASALGVALILVNLYIALKR
jgi:hypothetical protein